MLSCNIYKTISSAIESSEKLFLISKIFVYGSVVAPSSFLVHCWCCAIGQLCLSQEVTNHMVTLLNPT